MKLVKWKVSEGPRLLDCGSKHSESERLVLDELLNGELGKFTPSPDRSYTLQAGDLLTSAYGDEFERVRGAAYLDDAPTTEEGHLFAPPVVAGLPCAHPSMNRDVWIDGEKHAGCDSCDFVSPDPVVKRAVRETYPHPYNGPELSDPACGYDADRAREDRELARAIEKAAADGDLDPTSARDLLKGLAQGIARKVVRDMAEKVLREAIGAAPVRAKNKGKPCQPHEHRIVEHRREELAETYYHCVVCGRSYAVQDQMRLLDPVPQSMERMVRGVLSLP